MNILFLTLLNIRSINDRNIYTDLLRKFHAEGHNVFIVCPCERRSKQSTSLEQLEGINLLKVRTLNIQKTNLFEKGLSITLLENIFLAQIKKYFFRIMFDLVIYSTPPINFTKVLGYIKKKNNAKTYLLLKDIFPQNAVDLGLIRKNGLLHRYFRIREQNLYKISDYIGCMTIGNVKYLIENNPGINPNIVEVNPNSIEPSKNYISLNMRCEIRKRLSIPISATVFIYGGNLGKPQGVEFLIAVLGAYLNNQSVYFVIVGSGTEFKKIHDWFETFKPNNSKLISYLEKEDFDQMLQACDVGMVFLDRRFSIPNFPSRLLSYLEFKLPILAATDIVTDLRQIITENGFGLWSEFGDLKGIMENVGKFVADKDFIKVMGENGFGFLLNNYTVTNSCAIILKHFDL